MKKIINMITNKPVNKRGSFSSGDILSDRYKLSELLGYGLFSNVWEAVDKKTGNNVAIKILKHGKDNHDIAVDEIKILTKLTKNNKHNAPVLKLKSNFTVTKNGHKHYCLVFKKYGCNLYELIKYVYNVENKKLPLNIINYIAKQLLQAIKFVHKQEVIHTDIKLENIMLYKTINDIDFHSFKEEDFKLVLVDFGTACWFDEHFSDYVQSMEMRAPECILGSEYNEKIDIWSIACCIFELVTGKSLFQLETTHYSDSSESSDDHELLVFVHLFKIQSLLGKLPHTNYVKYRDYYDSNNNLRHFHPDMIPHRGLKTILQKDYNVGKKSAKKIEDLLLPMLELNPNKRHSAHDMLLHEWFH
jgi:serine/threonine protein kinase